MPFRVHLFYQGLPDISHFLQTQSGYYTEHYDILRDVQLLWTFSDLL